MRRLRISSSAGLRTNGCPAQQPYLLEILHESGLVADRLLLSEDELAELVGQGVAALGLDDDSWQDLVTAELVQEAVADLTVGG